MQSTQTRNKSNSLLQQQQQFQLQEKALKIKSKIQVCSIVATITQTAANRNELSRKSLTAVGVAHNKSNAWVRCTQMLFQVRIESCLLAKS